MLGIIFLSFSTVICATDIELCPREDRNEFISTLKENCGGALTRLEFRPPQLPSHHSILLPPFKPTEISDADLDIACQPSCGGSYSKWLREGCDDPYTARSIEVMCLRTPNTGIGSRCRFAFPDVFDSRLLVIRLIVMCDFRMANVCATEAVAERTGSPTYKEKTSNFGVCATFREIIDIFGCCYNSVFNDTKLVRFFAGNGLLTSSMVEKDISIGVSHVWDECMIDVPAVCASALCSAPCAVSVLMLALISTILHTVHS